MHLRNSDRRLRARNATKERAVRKLAPRAMSAASGSEIRYSLSPFERMQINPRFDDRSRITRRLSQLHSFVRDELRERGINVETQLEHDIRPNRRGRHRLKRAQLIIVRN